MKADELESLPAAAAAIFGARLDRAQAFATHLASSGVERGLLGPREVERIWTRHVLNCAVLSELVPAGVRVIDVGSGAGLPGVALALARPDLDVVLVEPLERRTTWLAEVLADLDIQVRVVRARAEDLAGVEQAEVVTARAVAALPKLAGWGLPLVCPGGSMLAIKGQGAAQELQVARSGLLRSGVVSMEIALCGVGLVEVPTTVVRLTVGADAGRRSKPALRARRP